MNALLLAQEVATRTHLSSILANPVALFFGSIALIVIVPTAIHYWAKVRTREARTHLVQDLAARGMSAEEIQQVLQAARLDKDVS